MSSLFTVMTEAQRKPNARCSICQKAVYKRPSQLMSAKDGIYCGRACFGLACRKEVPCVICAKPILAGLHKKTCSQDCSKLYRHDPTRPHCKGRKANKAKRTSTRTFRIDLMKQRGKACQLCGYDRFDIFNIHHIVEKHNGGTDELDNLLLVCPNCHTEIHKGFRQLDNLIKQEPC